MASTDEQLLQGGPQAFGEFYARHERAVFRTSTGVSSTPRWRRT